LLGPYREYGIACRVNGTNHPEGIFWGLYEEGTVISTRTYRRNGETYLIIVGKPHKVGQKENNEEIIASLEEFAQTHFDVQETTFRWGGQHYRPADLLPFIGPVKKGSTEFIATGYSTDGLVYGTLAAHILTDMITGQDNKWVNLYDSTRKQPLKSGPKFLKENIDVASHYIKDMVGPGDFPVQELKKGEGKVIKKEGKRLAVSRNEDGELEVISAVCTHMGCNVHWNNAEKSWDCPCHGSRFSTDGTVLEGPALDPLPKNPIRM
jgi:Rieske Fe-S protein